MELSCVPFQRELNELGRRSSTISDIILVTSYFPRELYPTIWKLNCRLINCCFIFLLQAAARAHFNCSTLEGMELENQGGSGTSSAHFEKRIVQVSLLRNDELGGASCWYDVDLTQADNWQWGKGLGCDFVTKSCYEYGLSKHEPSTYPWCKTPQGLEFHCLSYDNAYGSCDLIRYGQILPSEYRYFTSLPGVASSDLSYYGSSNFLADYCPSIQVSFSCVFMSSLSVSKSQSLSASPCTFVL
ncbi:unnamed protein product [Echinostoma caproni]|uniref:Leishmanolysin-like peptidase n=1 Tax=Echinostoma caproni TaxID=27848 RepID=A0A183AKP4_9TREM|nr:unnamed protein product [Echinostoma caproni]